MSDDSTNIEYSNDSSPNAETPEVTLDETPTRAWPLEEWECLVRVFDTDALWRWLNVDERRPILRDVARGFQVSSRVLRQALVKKRLAQHFLREHEIGELIIATWQETPTAKKALAALEAITDETQWQEQKSALQREHGADVIRLAALFQNRFEIDEADNRVLEVSATPTQSTPQKPPVDHERKRLMEQIASLKTRLRGGENQLSVTRKQAESARQDAAKAQAEREQDERRVAQRQAENQKQLDEVRALLDRANRKVRQLEQALEESHAETKRLHRVVRQTQKLNEEQRRQIATVTAQLAKSEEWLAAQQTSQPAEAPPKQKATEDKPKSRPLIAKTKVVVPQEQVFVWDADGHEVRICPRQVREAIDRNDEAQVHRWVQDLDALLERDEELHGVFLTSVRDMGRYYKRVLTTSTTRVLVDASNVARFEKDARDKGQLRALLAMRDELRRHDFFPIVMIADASLPHNIDEPQELKQMIARGEIEMTNAGVQADDILAREARRSSAYVVTNDRNFHRNVAPDWEPARITFFIRAGVVELGDF